MNHHSFIAVLLKCRCWPYASLLVTVDCHMVADWRFDRLLVLNDGNSRAHGYPLLKDLWKALLRYQRAQDTRPLLIIALFLSHCRGYDVVSLFRQRIQLVFVLLCDLASIHGILRLWMVAGRARREHYLALRLGLRGQYVRLVFAKR